MYNITIADAKPDIKKLKETVEKLMTRGVRVADCKELLERYANLRAALRDELTEKYGIENPNSPKQIIDFLKEMSNKVDLHSTNDILNICRDDEGKWTSNADALTALADLGYEFAQDLLDYRHAKSFAQSIESIVKETDINSLIHPEVSLGKTNRINYSKPALLNIPKQLLWHIVEAYDNENVLYSVDIKNQEPGILIGMTGSKELRYALESEEGLYEVMFKQCFKPTVTANVLIDTLPENRIYSISELKKIGTISPALYSPCKPQVRKLLYKGIEVIGFETICIGSEKGLKPTLPDKVSIELQTGDIVEVDVVWESVDKKYKKANDYEVIGELQGLETIVTLSERNEFKKAWLSISYGASCVGVEKECKVISGKKAYNYITKVEGLKQYRSNISKWAKEGNTTIGTIFGTQLDAGECSNFYHLKRVLLDIPIQGSGADILSLLIQRIEDYTNEHNIADKVKLYYTRHDEVILEVNKNWVNEIGHDEVVKILKDMLEYQIDDWTPFKVEVSCVSTHDINNIKADE